MWTYHCTIVGAFSIVGNMSDSYSEKVKGGKFTIYGRHVLEKWFLVPFHIKSVVQDPRKIHARCLAQR